MYSRFFTAIVLVTFLLTSVRPALAITEQEREILHRLYREIKAARDMVDAAQQAADSNQRIQVDYQKLRNDLDKILEGIEDVEKIKRREPRDIVPLNGNYK